MHLLEGLAGIKLPVKPHTILLRSEHCSFGAGVVGAASVQYWRQLVVRVKPLPYFYSQLQMQDTSDLNAFKVRRYAPAFSTWLRHAAARVA